MTITHDIHLVCLDHPYPPNYGGVIDIYYKWKTFTDMGIRPVVHVFHKPNRNIILPDLPYHELHFYPRKMGWNTVLSAKPYIIASRHSSELYSNLIKDDAPILFEGVHSLAVLPSLKKHSKSRRCFVRVHNVEQHYYQELFVNESNLKRKLFFFSEMLKLKRFENDYLGHADGLFPLSKDENQYLTRKGLSSEWIPAFLPHRVLTDCPHNAISKSTYEILFHGNFEVEDNIRSANWLSRNIAPHLPQNVRLIFAGKKANTTNQANIPFIIPDPPNMSAIIDRADAIVLPNCQKSGVKLKTLISLAHQKITLVTPSGMIGTGLTQEMNDLHWIFEDANGLLEKVNALTENGFRPPAEAEKLWKKFDSIYDAKKNAQRMLDAMLQ